ncbi:hypothetical protein [Streptomyces sp. NBC_00827]|uniref:hypothetical protein n=1 Tax=Streptomyces sp. NBC_00827 TaxID=2903677 RepID=UPI00386BFF05|nr:hypothetical protein OG569_42465 [Streptomyces sp. NBC_00827]
MMQAIGNIRNSEQHTEHVWPLRAQAVSHIGSAYVVQGTGDFDLNDLNLVRHQFPDRHVTLDGDAITVWPTSLT